MAYLVLCWVAVSLTAGGAVWFVRTGDMTWAAAYGIVASLWLVNLIGALRNLLTSAP